ncbi:hypothetical protein [Clostridium sp.]|uniref:hypothetical protein n=1 Tax=Clostridium sp. TaxID=1506 RepID=UPI002FC5C7EA
MSKFVVSATVDDKYIKGDAKFRYRIIDNPQYIIDDFGGVEAHKSYTPQIGDTFTVEVSYICPDGFRIRTNKTFTVKI